MVTKRVMLQQRNGAAWRTMAAIHRTTRYSKRYAGFRSQYVQAEKCSKPVLVAGAGRTPQAAFCRFMGRSRTVVGNQNAEPG